MSASSQAAENINSTLEPGNEDVMNQKIDEQLEEVEEHEFESSSEEVVVGNETEFFLTDSKGNPLNEDERDEIVGKDSEDDNLDRIEHELGASMAEIASSPVSEEKILLDLYRQTVREEEKLRKRSDGKVLRQGANPVQDLNKIERTSGPKYQEVPDAYGEMRTNDFSLGFSEDLGIERVTDEFGRHETINPRNEDLPAAIAASQLNMEADGVEDGFEKANIGYAIAPYITALSGNSRFIDGKDLGFNDTRMEIWEKAFDIGGFECGEDIDIGKINSYFTGLEDYGKRIKQQPRIVNDTERPEITQEVAEAVEENPLDAGQGMFWKDSRVKLVDEDGVRDEVVVEFRQNSVQPTVEEDIAVQAFYIGRVIYEQEVAEGDDYLGENPEALPEIVKINENRYDAMRNGLEADLYDWNGEKGDSEEILEEEIDKAVEGLHQAGIEDPGFMDILYDRLEAGKTPSDEVAEAYYSNILESEDYNSETHQAANPGELPEEIKYEDITEQERKQHLLSASQEIRPNYKGNKVKVS